MFRFGYTHVVFITYSASVSLNWRLLNQEKLPILHYFLHHYLFFVTSIKFWNENRHNYQKPNLDYYVIISKNRIFTVLSFFQCLIFSYDGICTFCRLYYFNLSLHWKFIHWIDKIECNNIFSCIDTNFVKISASD